MFTYVSLFLSFYFVVHLDCIGASRCLVTPKLGRQQQQCQGESGVESRFKLTFHYWQPPFDHSTITFKNFVSLDYYVQDFCKSLPFSPERQIPVYSSFVICCRRSVGRCHPSIFSIHSPSPLSLLPLPPFIPPPYPRYLLSTFK